MLRVVFHLAMTVFCILCGVACGTMTWIMWVAPEPFDTFRMRIMFGLTVILLANQASQHLWESTKWAFIADERRRIKAMRKATKQGG